MLLGGGDVRDAAEDGDERGRVREDMNADAGVELIADTNADGSEDEERATNVDLGDATEENGAEFPAGVELAAATTFVRSL